MTQKTSNEKNSSALNLAVELISKPSVTAASGNAMGNALDVVEGRLKRLGFTCTRYPFGEGEVRVDNLYARLGTAQPNFCFAGHVDVVPAGETEGWSESPFEGVIKDLSLIHI